MKWIWVSLATRFLRLYLFLYLSVFLHEMAHYFAARIIGIRETCVCIGFDGFLGIRIKNFFISPIAISGWVSVPAESLANLSRSKRAIFWFSGVFVNCIEAVVGLLFRWWVLAAVALLIILACMMPWRVFDSDLYHYLKG